MCSICQKIGDESNLLRCNICNETSYCSSDCQNLHLFIHRLSCYTVSAADQAKAKDAEPVLTYLKRLYPEQLEVISKTVSGMGGLIEWILFEEWMVTTSNGAFRRTKVSILSYLSADDYWNNIVTALNQQLPQESFKKSEGLEFCKSAKMKHALRIPGSVTLIVDSLHPVQQLSTFTLKSKINSK